MTAAAAFSMRSATACGDQRLLKVTARLQSLAAGLVALTAELDKARVDREATDPLQALALRAVADALAVVDR